MTSIDWPNVRTPLRAGWQGSAPDGVRLSPMDQGPSKRRVESTAAGAVETFQFKLSDADAAVLDDFYKANKARRFNFPHPVWGAVEACFVSAPRWSEVALWRVAEVQLEIYR